MKKFFKRNKPLIVKQTNETTITWHNLNTHWKTTSGTKALEWIKGGYDVEIITE